MLGVAALAAAYGWFIDGWVNLLLVAITAAVIYIALATVLEWQQVDPVMPLLSSIRK
jgi:hypothetical protein